MPLSVENRVLVDAAKELSRRAPELSAVAALSRAAEDAEIPSLLPAARREADALRRREIELEELRGALTGALRQAAEAKARAEELERVKRAAAEVERWLLQGSTVNQRVQEARMSLWKDKMDRHLRQSVQIERQDEGPEHLVLALQPAAWGEIKGRLHDGYRYWIGAHSRSKIQEDLGEFIKERWSSLEGPLALPSPRESAEWWKRLQIACPWDYEMENRWWEGKEPPEDIRRSHKLPTFSEDLLPTLKQQGYWVFGLLGLAGVRSVEQSQLTIFLIALLLAIPLALWLVWRERARRLERLLSEGERSLQEEVLRWVEGRMDRDQPKIRDHFYGQLRGPLRAQWIDWYTTVVRSAEEEVRDARERAQQAQRQTEERLKALERLPFGELDRFLDAARARK